MAAITAAVLGGVTAAVTTGMSFAQAAKQKKAASEANAAAEKALNEAKKALEVNYYKGLSIQKEPYELEREALAQAGAQAMEAGRETERGVAATAGRIQMAQNVGQRQVAGAMGQELAGLEKLTAEEESRLRDARAQIALEESAGAKQAAADAAKASQQATMQGVEGVVGLGTQVASAVPLYMKGAGTRAENKFTKLASSGSLAPQYKDMSFQQAIGSTPGYESVGKLNPLEFEDWKTKQNRQFFNNFNFAGVTAP